MLGTVVSLTAMFAAYEYLSFKEHYSRDLKHLGVLLAGLLPLVAVIKPTYQEFAGPAFAIVLFASIVSLILVMKLQWPQGFPIESAAVTVMCVLYTGGTLSFWIFLRAFPEEMFTSHNSLTGTFLLVFPIWITWAGDSVAYVVGSLWGRKKLLVEVSPNKTVLGAFGGILGSVIAGIVYNHYLLHELTEVYLSTEMVVVTSGLLALIGQLGDLSESVMKRQAKVKDSSSLIPGHGGVLDRMDGLFFTVPVTYFIFLFYL